MYQALYRKWRPRTFDDVVGQEHITETLKRQVNTDRLSHAYLFVGTRGTGKTTCAKILSRAVNCEHPVNGNPCNKCKSCLGIEDGSILDVAELDAASNNGVDHVRALRDEAVFSPASVKKRVYIIDEVHMLSVSAFNALLKILEEPPAHLMFILATTELHKVPATILSRCQRFSFKRILPEDIASRLKYVASQEGIDLTDDGAALLARLSDGAMRDALSLLDQCISDGTVDSKRIISAIGLAGNTDTLELFNSIKSGDIKSSLDTVSRLYQNGKDMKAVVNELTSLTRDVLIYKLSPDNCSGLLSGIFDNAAVKEAAGGINPQQIMSWLDVLKSAGAQGSSSTARLDTELCILRLCSRDLLPDTAAISLRLDELERKLSGGVVVNAAPPPVSEPKAAERPSTKKPQEDTPPWDIDEPALKEEPENRPTENAAPPVMKEEPAPAPAPRPGSADWNGILAEAEKAIDAPTYSLLCDRSMADGEIYENAVTVKVKNPFMMNVFNTQEIISAISKSAASVLGHPVKVTVKPDDGKVQVSEDKLDSLSKFDIISFE